MQTPTLSGGELKKLEVWYEANKSAWPTDISNLLSRLLKVQLALHAVMQKNKNLLVRLREAMGFAPKSEKGSQLNEHGGAR